KCNLRSFSKAIAFAKQWARQSLVAREHILPVLDEIIAGYLHETCYEWSGPRHDLFTDDFLTYVLLKDDAALFAEYLALLNPSDETFKTSVLDWVDKAIDMDANRIVSVVLTSPHTLRTDALERAVAAESAGVVRVLLSKSEESWPLPLPAVANLLRKALSESVLKTIEAVFERPPSGLVAARLSLPHNCLCLPQPTGLTREAAARFRRRALAVIARVLDPVVQCHMAQLLPRLCALGHTPSLAELRAAVSEFGDPRRMVLKCVESAAESGEAGVVVQLLQTDTLAGEVDRLAAIDKALYWANWNLQTEVAERVLAWADAQGVPQHKLAFIIRSCIRNDWDALDRPTIYRCFQRALMRYT
ncbi:hypothetical protein HK405_002749, partial [Cladochytrium tenue]